MLFLWAILISLLIFMWIFFLPIFVIGFTLAIPFFVVALPLSLLIAGGIYLSFDNIKESSLRDIVASAPFHRWFRRIHVPLDLSKHHLICCHPHGVLCTMAIVGIHLKPKSKTLIAVAPIVFTIPVIGWIAKHLGAIPATYKHIVSALQETSVILLPGGVPEIVSHEIKQSYTDRIGFLKCARQAGVNIYSVIGKQRYYDLLRMPFHGIRMHIAKTYNLPAVFPWVFGWYGTWMPLRNPIEPTVKYFEMDRGDIKETRKRYYARIHP